ncbi:MAG: hypothetical protein AAB508_06660 [Patescibacteria group bacterium]
MPKKTRLQKIKSDQRRHHFSPDSPVHEVVSPAETIKASSLPQYSLRERLAPEKSSDRMRTILSPQITAMIDPKEFHAIKLDLLKTSILAVLAFMTELFLYMRLNQK